MAGTDRFTGTMFCIFRAGGLVKPRGCAGSRPRALPEERACVAFSMFLTLVLPAVFFALCMSAGHTPNQGLGGRCEKWCVSCWVASTLRWKVTGLDLCELDCELCELCELAFFFSNLNPRSSLSSRSESRKLCEFIGSCKRWGKRRCTPGCKALRRSDANQLAPCLRRSSRRGRLSSSSPGGRTDSADGIKTASRRQSQLAAQLCRVCVGAHSSVLFGVHAIILESREHACSTSRSSCGCGQEAARSCDRFWRTSHLLFMLLPLQLPGVHNRVKAKPANHWLFLSCCTIMWQWVHRLFEASFVVLPHFP